MAIAVRVNLAHEVDSTKNANSHHFACYMLEYHFEMMQCQLELLASIPQLA
jgi:hypothetical protein